jgi:hypothetical protein
MLGRFAWHFVVGLFWKAFKTQTNKVHHEKIPDSPYPCSPIKSPAQIIPGDELYPMVETDL